MEKNKRIDIFLLIFILAVFILTGSLVVNIGHEASLSSGGKSDVLCADHLDNDGDGLVDCNDPDCCWAPVCWPVCGGDPDCPGADWVAH